MDEVVVLRIAYSNKRTYKYFCQSVKLKNQNIKFLLAKFVRFFRCMFFKGSKELVYYNFVETIQVTISFLGPFLWRDKIRV
jgi:hypothetical protein